MNQPEPSRPFLEPRNYLNAESGILSWLGTRDHKRIGVMYLVLTAVALAVFRRVKGVSPTVGRP